MSTRLLILRPEPGASESVARAAVLGIDALAAPIFTIRPLAWVAPDPRRYDAILFTSANAVRCGGDQLRRFVHLTCFAVGEATATAAAAVGFEGIVTGPGDGEAVVAIMEHQGIGRALHPCGRDHIALGRARLPIDDIPVYAAEPVATLAATAIGTIGSGALVALHSPRAARRFAELVQAAGLSRADIGLVAISEAAAAAAGEGWKSKAVAPAPRDDALLVLTAKLCNNDGAATGVGE